MHSLIAEAQQGIRVLLKNPGFTLVAVVTIALGIGANTAIFSLVNGLLLKPLPYPEPDRLVALSERDPAKGLEQGLVSGPNFLDWQNQSTLFSSMCASPGWSGSSEFNLVQRDTVTKVKGTYSAASYFTTLGVPPLLGRTFLPEEDLKEGNRVAVLSHRLWQSRFAGDSNVLGQPITIDSYGRRQYIVVGVMPPGFGVPGESELWLPLGWMGVSLTERRSAHWHTVLARLKPGVTLDQARLELNTIQSRIRQEHPEAMVGSEVGVVSLLQGALGRHLHLALLVLWGVVGGVLLIACANVANLLLARAAERQKEIALRMALGASRWRIVRQLLVESLLLSSIGGALGLVLAQWGLHLVVTIAPSPIPRLNEVTLDGTALIFTLAASIATGLLFGLAPAWQFSRPALNDALKSAGPGLSAGILATRTRNGLVVAQVAISLMLLVGAGLMLRSFAHLSNMDRGFQPEHLLTAALDYSVSGYTTWVQPTNTRPQVTQHEILERLRRRPGVIAAAITSSLPRHTDGPPAQTFLIEGRAVSSPQELPRSAFQAVSPDYFRTMGIRLLQGRDFAESDQLQSPGVLIINQTMARQWFPGEDPIGKRLAFPARNNPLVPEQVPPERGGTWREIVGVVADMKSLSQRPEPVVQTYVPYWQWPMQSPTVVVRATNDLASLAAAIRTEVKTVAPNLPQPLLRTMDHILAETMAHPRFQTWLFGLFGALALLLASVGVYGVLACMVAKRTHEIGIRVALGAQRGRVLNLVIGQGMKLILIGVCFGALGSIALTRVLTSLLYGVSPKDPLTFFAAILALPAVALLACVVPAWRAARIHPMEALRYE